MLIVVALAAVAARVLGLPIATIDSAFGGIPPGFPAPALPKVDAQRFLAVLPNAATAAYVADLLAMTVEERRALPYMHPGRADVIGAGALIWTRILDRVPVMEHVVSEADILHGIAAGIAR